MSTEHDLFLANAEMNRRNQWAAEERKARAARRDERNTTPATTSEETHKQGGFSWLRRMAGNRA